MIANSGIRLLIVGKTSPCKCYRKCKGDEQDKQDKQDKQDEHIISPDSVTPPPPKVSNTNVVRKTDVIANSRIRLLIFGKISPCKCYRNCKGDSMEKLHADVRVSRVDRDYSTVSYKSATCKGRNGNAVDIGHLAAQQKSQQKAQMTLFGYLAFDY